MLKSYLGSVIMAIGLGIGIIPYLIAMGFNYNPTEIYLVIGIIIGNLGLFIQVITPSVQKEHAQNKNAHAVQEANK